jgi:carboxypeptidase family protein
MFVGALALAASLGAQQRIPRQGEAATSIEGVVRAANGLGVVAARIGLRAADGMLIEKETTADGVFLLPEIQPGTYRLTVTGDGFRALEREVQVLPGVVTTLELTLTAIPPAEPGGLRNVPRATGGPPLPPLPEASPSPYRELPTRKEYAIPGNDPGPAEPLAAESRVFTPVPNRWQYEFPKYHRYAGSGDIQYVDGHWYDPFNRNKAKGDYPIFGNRTFLNLTVTSDTFADGRRLPVGSGVGSSREDSADFFGRFGQFALLENVAVSATLFHGDTSFRPIDWQIRVTPEFNFNYVSTQENGIVNIDVRKGTTRYDQHAGLQEAFFELRLKDLSNEYDFVSARIGTQSFNSDFRGFIFNDQEPGLRVFGNLKSNRYQYNLAAFAMVEKDTNSGLNRFEYRHRQVFVANLYRQDFFKPGYTIQASFHYDKDDATLQYDQNHFLVRPQAIGAVKPHAIRSYYYGLTGDGHIGRINVSHAFYQVLGHDTLNPLAGRKVDINAQMAALELSLDKDWLRYRVSFFWASGEKHPRGDTAHGFDTILDNPNFNGGIFSFWNREGIRLTSTGVGLMGGDSLVPSLRSSKSEGQGNFVNPGIYMYNAGVDADVLPKLRAFGNLNLIRFDRTAPLELLLFQKPIHAGVGADSGIGVKYRPKLSDNISITSGFNAFFPFQGFKDIYTGKTLFSLFTNVRFQF